MKRLMVAALVASMFTATVAMADPDKHDRGGRHNERSWNDRDDDRRGHRPDHRDNDRRWDDGRHGGRHDSRHDGKHWERRDAHRHDHYRYYDRRYDGRYRVARYYPPRGYYRHAWYRGARLPAAYYAPRYVVYDYGAYRLRPPPRGYHWVRVDNDVVMAAIATGVVLAVVNDIFH